ncbi:MAG: hypothetical protein P8M25_11550 [Paracoccaceae bacterium]|nr:hypothetical protein [Paracoccaceae bacterium]
MRLKAKAKKPFWQRLTAQFGEPREAFIGKLRSHIKSISTLASDSERLAYEGLNNAI